MSAFKIIPLTLKQANALVIALHRHHKPTIGHRFSIGAVYDSQLVGGCIVGRPVAPKTNAYLVAEVTRLVSDGTPNCCSFLYGAASRIAKEMGFSFIQTFILENEPGTSLKAAGWVFDGWSDGADGWQSRDGRRTDQPTCKKARWVNQFERSRHAVEATPAAASSLLNSPASDALSASHSA